MTYQEFKNKWLGKGINYDGAYGNQCMDVYRMYVKEVLGCPQSPGVTGAKDVWNTYLPQYFDRIANSPTGVPQQGDIVIWGMNPYGHIAICDSATTSTLTCFEQNWTESDGSGVAEIRKHNNYNNVLGWLHFKSIIEDMTQEEKNILKFLAEQKAGEGDVREAFGALAEVPVKNGQIQTLTEKVLDLDKTVKELQDRVRILEGELTANLDLVSNQQKEVTTAKKQLENKNKELEEMTTEKNKFKGYYETKCEEIKKLDKMTAWQHIRYGIKLLVNK